MCTTCNTRLLLGYGSDVEIRDTLNNLRNLIDDSRNGDDEFEGGRHREGGVREEKPGMNPGRIMPSVAPPPAMDVPSDLPSELWQKVVGHLVSEESGGAESVAKVACLCRSARDATSSDPDLWRCLLDAEYVPVTSRAETMHLEEYDGFISRFDERRIERSPSTASLGALTRGERERGGKRNIRREAREARKFYSAWANGKPAEDLVHWNAHALKDRSKRVLYGSRVNALVLDTAGLADHESRAPGFCWSCGGDGLIHRWDMSRGQRVSTSKDAHQFAPEVSGYRQINNMGIECAASCGPEMLITGGGDKGISLWGARLGAGTNGRYKEAWHKSCAHYDEVLSIAAARTLPLIISGGADDCVRVWDLRYMDDPLLELDTFHGGSVFCIAIDEETRRVYTGSGDKTISLWGLETGHWYAQAHGHHGDVYDIKVGKDNKVVSASDDGKLLALRWPPGGRLLTASILSPRPSFVIFSLLWFSDERILFFSSLRRHLQGR